jgi:thiol-disulfide isomerase/thioredoxin
MIALAGSKPKPIDLTLSDLDGARVHLRDLRGRIVVFNLWATWCGPCKAELPLLVAAQRQYKDRGVAFVAASLDDAKSRPRIPEFLKQFDIQFPVWTGASADDLTRLGLGEAAPATAFIDEEGYVAARVSGQIREFEIKERIDWLLTGKSGAGPKTFVQHLSE